ncbi:hypothetical protein EDD15DRAFT_1659424 [Pisolithus albus]|nr:hypothetical protein EDD15DRAFT_1659424 [Pisolithus albus]
MTGCGTTFRMLLDPWNLLAALWLSIHLASYLALAETFFGARNHRLNPTPLSAPDGCSHEPHSHQPVAWLFPWLPSLWRTGGTKPPYEKIIPGQTWIPMRRFDRCEVENCPVSAKGEATTYHRTSR